MTATIFIAGVVTGYVVHVLLVRWARRLRAQSLIMKSTWRG
jgi:hypothetical protein